MALLAWQTLGYGLLGQDTYRILLTSRVTSGAELADLLGQRLMRTHNFYRPLFTLTIALDQALWGLEPLGYQLANVIFFAGCAATTGLVARRLGGRGARVAPLVAVAIFVLFPRHFEVLPVIARRPEMMAYSLALLGLWLQLSPRALAAERPRWLPALALLAAAASKDNGPVLAPLFPLAVFLASPRAGPAARLRHAARAALPHAVLLGAFLAVRSRIVVGLGGRTRELLDQAAGIPANAARALDFLARPEPLLEPTSVSTGLLAAFVATTGVALALGRSRGEGSAPDGDRHPERLVAVGALWVLLVTLSYALRGAVRSWYAFLPLGGWVLLLAGTAEHLLVLRERGRGAARTAASLGAASLLAMVLWHARTSPVVYRYPEWRVRTAALERFHAELARRIEAAGPGSVVECPPPPAKGERPSERPFIVQLDAVPLPALRSWAELTFPDLRIRFVPPDRARVRRADTVVVALPGE